jgi:hypothetical protein
LTERKVLQQNPKPLHLQKDAIEELTNFKLDIPTIRLKKGINISSLLIFRTEICS